MNLNLNLNSDALIALRFGRHVTKTVASTEREMIDEN